MSLKTIVVTRPQQEAEPLTQALHEAGHHVICEPLTAIFLNHTVRGALEQALAQDPEAVIATSRNGVYALAALTELRDCILLCVGEATANAASSVGFTRVYSGGGTVEALTDYIVDAYDAGSRFVYVCAEHTRADLPAILGGYGMQTMKAIAYSAVAATSLSDTLVEQIKRGQIDAVTFMSQRSAEIFVQLSENAGIGEQVKSLEAFCLSWDVAAPLKNEGWQGIVVSDEPTLASLAESVDNG